MRWRSTVSNMSLMPHETRTAVPNPSMSCSISSVAADGVLVSKW